LSSKTVAIVYGFTEGKWHGKRLRSALAQHDFTVVSKTRDADIVIAHSGGCYNVPPELRPEQLLMLIAPPYWPGRALLLRSQSMAVQMLRAIRPGNEPVNQANKVLHNILFLFWHASKNLTIVRRARRYNLEKDLPHPNPILVPKKHDPWLTPNFRDLQRFNEHLRLIELPGDHDDIWLHPEPYINLIESEA
jgi:hypothetical protein